MSMNIQDYETLTLGVIEITAAQFEKWLKEYEGWRDFRMQSYEDMKQKYREAGKAIDTGEQIEAFIARLHGKKDGKLILAKAKTETEGLQKLDRYQLYTEGKKAGLCLNCGWKDGEGTRTCYYDKEVGAVVHENSWNYVLSQRSLIESYDSLRSSVYDEESEHVRRIRAACRAVSYHMLRV